MLRLHLLQHPPSVSLLCPSCNDTQCGHCIQTVLLHYNLYCSMVISILYCVLGFCAADPHPPTPPCFIWYVLDVIEFGWGRSKLGPNQKLVMCYMNRKATFSFHNEVINIRRLLLKVKHRCFRLMCFFTLLLCTVSLSTWHANCKWRNDAIEERTSKQSNVCHKRPSHNFLQSVVTSKTSAIIDWILGCVQFISNTTD